MTCTTENTGRKLAKIVKVSVIALGLLSTAQTAAAGDYWAASSQNISKAITPAGAYTVAGTTYTPKHQPNYDMVGTASWYGDKFHGKPTVSGEAYDKNDYTAAHKTLPLGSVVTVTNLTTGQALTVRINDRGPFVGQRLIDLSEAAAGALGMSANGLEAVRVQYAGQARAPIAVAPKPHQTAQTYSPLAFSPQTNLPAAQVAIPDSYMPEPGTDNQTVTMTIKGAIHMAQDNDIAPEARFIQAVSRTTYKSKT